MTSRKRLEMRFYRGYGRVQPDLVFTTHRLELGILRACWAVVQLSLEEGRLRIIKSLGNGSDDQWICLYREDQQDGFPYIKMEFVSVESESCGN